MVRGAERLPALKQQRQIAEATHAGVVAAVGEEVAVALCGLYAMVGSNLCNENVDGAEYQPAAGWLRVRLAGTDDDWWAQDIRPDTFGREYHAFILGKRSGRLEVVDLASRNHAALARRQGITQALSSHPAPLWVWADELPATIGYQTHRETTARVCDAFARGPYRASYEHALATARDVIRRGA